MHPTGSGRMWQGNIGTLLEVVGCGRGNIGTLLEEVGRDQGNIGTLLEAVGCGRAI